MYMYPSTLQLFYTIQYPVVGAGSLLSFFLQPLLNVVPPAPCSGCPEIDWPAAHGHLQLFGAFLPQLLEAPLLLYIRHPPLLKVLYPRRGAVPLKVGILLRTGLEGLGGVLVGIDDVVGVQAGEVGVAGGPADGALFSVGDGGAGADGVGASIRLEGPPAHRVGYVCVFVCLFFWGLT